MAQAGLGAVEVALEAMARQTPDQAVAHKAVQVAQV
jgi:hypothetical protein